MENFKIDLEEKVITLCDMAITININQLYNANFSNEKTNYTNEEIISKLKNNIKLHFDKNKELWLIMHINEFDDYTPYLAYNLNKRTGEHFIGSSLDNIYSLLDTFYERREQSMFQHLNEKFEKFTFDETINALDALI